MTRDRRRPEGELLTIRGERARPEGDSFPRGWQCLERGFSAFERTLGVPRGVDADALDATVEHGVLVLRLAKPEPLQPRRIAIAPGAHQRELEQAAG